MNLSHFCLFHRFQPALLLAKALCAWRSFVFSSHSLSKRCSRCHKQSGRLGLPFFFSSLPPHFSICLGSKHSSIRCFFLFSGCVRVSAFLLLLQRRGAAEMPRAVRLAQLYLERNCGNEVVGQHKEVIVIARRCGEEASFFSLFFLGFFYTRTSDVCSLPH